MEIDTVKSYFEIPNVVLEYAKAVDEVGLWKSEEILIEEYLDKFSNILELGCGAGRISINLARKGYKNLIATDLSENMVKIAQRLIEHNNLSIEAKVCDATKIDYDKSTFDGVIFGFNGLMQIPKKENRIKAMQNIADILKKDGVFIFTTHDRDVSTHKTYWKQEQTQWQHGSQDPRLDDYGDIFYKSDYGNIFIHSPSKEEIEEDIKTVGLELIFTQKRSNISSESHEVRDFSDDCIFWIAKKL